MSPLPLFAPTSHSGQVLSAAASVAGSPDWPRSVLLIDDELAIRAALRRFFTRRGWVVEEAADGAAARRLL